MNDLLQKLEAAIALDEQWARAACQAYPYATDKTLPADGVSWEWVVGEDWEPVTPDPVVDEFVTEPGFNCWLATKETWPDSRGHQMPRTYTHTVVEMDAAAAGHIIRNDPKRVLRRVARDRKLVELHTPRSHAKRAFVEDGRRKDPAVAHQPTGDFCWTACPTCGGRDWDIERFDVLEPCDTLRLLAEDYEIEVES